MSNLQFEVGVVETKLATSYGMPLLRATPLAGFRNQLLRPRSCLRLGNEFAT